MSKYLKGFFNKPGQTGKNNEETPTSGQTPQEKKLSSDPLDKPFDVDLTDLWKYDVEELSDYIHKYDKYAQDLKKFVLGMQKEVAIVKERLEISEQERKNLENDLINTKELLKSQDRSDRRQSLKSPKVQAEPQNQESGAKINFELIISKCFDASRLLGLSELSEFHIATATAMGQLEEIVENINKLIEAPWERIVDCLQYDNDDDGNEGFDLSQGKPAEEGEESKEQETKNTTANETSEIPTEDKALEGGEHGQELELSSTQGVEKKEATEQKKQPKETGPKRELLLKKLADELNLGLEKSYFVDEKAKATLVFGVNHIEKEIQRMRSNINTLIDKHKDLEEQAAKELSQDLEKIFPTGSSGGADLHKYTQQLERYINELKEKFAALEINKTKTDSASLPDNKLLDDAKKLMESQLSELREKLSTNALIMADRYEFFWIVEERKKTEQLTAQVQNFENEHGDIEDSLVNLKRENFNQTQKVERLEKQLTDAKEHEKELLTKQKAFEEQSAQTTQDLNNAQNKIEDLEKRIEDSERTRASLQEEVKILKEQLDKVISGQNQNENESQLEIGKLRVEANTLRDEIARLEKLSSSAESKKNDMENKLIQEKLKVDNMKRELQKLEENYNEARQNLKEQVEKGNETLQKMEHLETEYNDARKKVKEYRKSARKLKQQVTELQAKLDQEQTQLQKLQKDAEIKQSEEHETNTAFDKHDSAAKDIKLHELSAQAYDLLDRNDELLKLNDKLSRSLDETKNELDKITTQFNSLKEKREAGVKEIKRLNSIVEQVRAGNTDTALQKLASEKNFAVKASVLEEVKKSLAQLYKEYLNSIEYDKLDKAQSKDGRKTIMSSIVLPESIVKLEKRINDTILAVEEYLQIMISSQINASPKKMNEF